MERNPFDFFGSAYICDNTVFGECSRCGSCCGRFLPVTRREIKQVRRYAKEHGIKPRRDDYDCPFFICGRCAVYEARPLICQCYRCDQHKRNEFDRRLFQLYGRAQLVDMQTEFVKEAN